MQVHPLLEPEAQGRSVGIIGRVEGGLGRAVGPEVPET
jgi:hypothetical protein